MASLANTIRHYLPWSPGHRRQFQRNFLLQVYFTFVQSVGMASLLGFFSGVAIAFQANFGLTLFGGNDQLGKVLVFIVYRELAPLSAALLMIARSCTAIATEMATIKVQQEIEALQVLGISVYHYIVAPRLASGAVSLFCLAVNFWAAALIGGWIGANYHGDLPFSPYLSLVAASLTHSDILFFLLKTCIAGILVTRLAVNHGLSVGPATYEVPIATIRAVVDSLTTAFIIQAVLSALYYSIHGVNL